jgi:hypothetical protein
VREFVRVTSAISFRGTSDLDAEVVSHSEADDAVSQSEVLRTLVELAPWLNQDPSTSSCEQRWMATQPPPWVTPRIVTPTSRRFVAARDLTANQLMTRPTQAGLFTSGAVSSYPGMWRTFLELNSPNVLWGKPWHTWRLAFPNSVRISHIASAQDWAGLVERHPLNSESWVHPDWRSMSEEFDAIHFTPGAILATEGLAIESALGPIRPTYWDVESTLWLQWRFTSVELVDTDPKT